LAAVDILCAVPSTLDAKQLKIKKLGRISKYRSMLAASLGEFRRAFPTS